MKILTPRQQFLIAMLEEFSTADPPYPVREVERGWWPVLEVDLPGGLQVTLDRNCHLGTYDQSYFTATLQAQGAGGNAASLTTDYTRLAEGFNSQHRELIVDAYHHAERLGISQMHVGGVEAQPVQPQRVELSGAGGLPGSVWPMDVGSVQPIQSPEAPTPVRTGLPDAAPAAKPQGSPSGPGVGL